MKCTWWNAATVTLETSVVKCFFFLPFGLVQLSGSVLCTEPLSWTSPTRRKKKRTECKDEKVRKQNPLWDRTVQSCWTDEARIKPETNNKQRDKETRKASEETEKQIPWQICVSARRTKQHHQERGRGPTPPVTRHRVPHASCTAKGLKITIEWIPAFPYNTKQPNYNQTNPQKRGETCAMQETKSCTNRKRYRHTQSPLSRGRRKACDQVSSHQLVNA